MGAILHGGTLAAALRRFPDAPRPLIDLSTGINPVPFPLPPFPPGCLSRLPEPEQITALQVCAARAWGGLDPACVVAAPGTQALISLLPRLLPQPGLAILAPTYAEHEAAWRRAGTAIRLAPDLDALERGPEPAALLCNPNNPDGRVSDAARLRVLATQRRLLVVDEAFADLEPGVSLLPRLPPRTVVLRSFGKSYGLAGLRLGFLVAEPDTAAAIRDALGPWAVSGPALHAGLHALADAEWLAAAATRLDADATRLDHLLAGAGARVLGGTRLFRLVTVPDAQHLADHLVRRGILVRSFPDRPHLLRLGLPAPEHWPRVEAALASFPCS